MTRTTKQMRLPFALGLGLAWTLACAGQAWAVTYFVDFEKGLDTNSGVTAEAPFKRAPGDPSATGRVKNVVLSPGDVVQFAGGVTYRGQIVVPSASREQAMIVFRSAPNGPRAVISGFRKLNLVSQQCTFAVCKGITVAGQYAFVDLPFALAGHDLVRVNGRLLYVATYPTQPDPQFRDNLNFFRPTAARDVRRLADKVVIQQPELAKIIADYGIQDSSLDVWVMPNVIQRFPVRLEGTFGFALPANTQLFTNYPTRSMLINHPVSLDGDARFYATANDGKRLIFRADMAGPVVVEISSQANGFDLQNAQNVLIEGLQIEGFAAPASADRAGRAVQVVNSARIAVRNNVMTQNAHLGGGGVITIQNSQKVLIDSNSIVDNLMASGIRAGGDSLMIKNNTITNFARTGIYLGGTRDARVLSNRISGNMGVHGYGISAYLGNYNALFEDNVVTRCIRGFTVYGSDEPEKENNLVLRRNILNCNSGTTGANLGGTAVNFISWGKGLNGLTLEDNVMVNMLNPYSVRLDPSDRRVLVRNNVLDALNTGIKGVPETQTLEDNLLLSSVRTAPNATELDPVLPPTNVLNTAAGREVEQLLQQGLTAQDIVCKKMGKLSAGGC